MRSRRCSDRTTRWRGCARSFKSAGLPLRIPDMNFEFTDIQRETQKMCREFAARELTPNARRWDHNHEWPAEAVRKLAELSLLGVAVPEAYGGAGLDNVCYALAIEE